MITNYRRAAVLGSGSLSIYCAERLMEAGVSTRLFDTGDTASAMSERQAKKKGICYRRVPKECRAQLAEELAQLRTPTLVVSAINPWILPDSVLRNPCLGAVNCHQALLPAHPGRNAEMWAIFEGDAKTGITWHILTEQVDAGGILCQRELALTGTSTALGVFRQQIRLAGEAFREILPALLDGTAQAAPQSGERGMLRFSWELPANGRFDPSWPFEKASAFLRAFDYGALKVVKRPQLCFGGRPRGIAGYHISVTGEEQQGREEAGLPRQEALSGERLLLCWPNRQIELRLCDLDAKGEGYHGTVDGDFNGAAAGCGF